MNYKDTLIAYKPDLNNLDQFPRAATRELAIDTAVLLLSKRACTNGEERTALFDLLATSHQTAYFQDQVNEATQELADVRFFDDYRERIRAYKGLKTNHTRLSRGL